MNLLNWGDGELLSSVRSKIMTMFTDINREGNNIAASAPASPVAGQVWTNISQGKVYQRNTANTGWVEVRNIDQPGGSPLTYGVSVWKKSTPPAGITGDITNYNAVWDNQSAAFNTITGVYTVPVTGLYDVSFDAVKHNDANTCEVVLYRNGSPSGVRSYTDIPNAYIPMHFHVRGNFVAGDTLKVVVTTGNIHNNDSCYLNIYRAAQ